MAKKQKIYFVKFIGWSLEPYTEWKIQQFRKFNSDWLVAVGVPSVTHVVLTCLDNNSWWNKNWTKKYLKLK